MEVRPYFFSVLCLSLLISPSRRSRLSQRSRVSLNFAFMLLICVTHTCALMPGQKKNNNTQIQTYLNRGVTPNHLLCSLLLQMNNLVLPVDSLRFQLAGQQVRVLREKDSAAAIFFPCTASMAERGAALRYGTYLQL